MTSFVPDKQVTTPDFQTATITDEDVAKAHPNAEDRFARRRERIPTGRLGDISEVADVALFLASPRSSFLTGHEFFVSGGAIPWSRSKRRQ